MVSPSGTGLDLATIISTSIEGILYGISLVLFGGTMWAQIHGHPKDEINWSMVLVALTLTILSTIHLTVDIQRLVDGFVINADTFPGGPVDFFADMTQTTFIIKNAVYILQTLLGDAVVIYRCYSVWRRLRFIVLPMVLWCAAFAISAGFLYNLLYATDPEDVFLLDIRKWVIPFYLLTMVTNLLSSVLLAYRVWTTNRDEPGVVRVLSRRGVEGSLLLRVLVDAAALYTFTLGVLIACYAYQNIGQLIVLDMMTPIISITFYTILVRIAIARSASPTTVPGLPAALSPLRFAATVITSPSEPTLVTARRSSV